MTAHNRSENVHHRLVHMQSLNVSLRLNVLHCSWQSRQTHNCLLLVQSFNSGQTLHSWQNKQYRYYSAQIYTLFSRNTCRKLPK